MPFTPPAAVALIVTAPVATAVTNPEPLTVALAVLLLSQEKVTPGTVAPPASVAVALSCTVVPTAKAAVLAGVTVTVAPASLRRIVPLAPTTTISVGEVPQTP